MFKAIYDKNYIPRSPFADAPHSGGLRGQWAVRKWIEEAEECAWCVYYYWFLFIKYGPSNIADKFPGTPENAIVSYDEFIIDKKEVSKTIKTMHANLLTITPLSNAPGTPPPPTSPTPQSHIPAAHRYARCGHRDYSFKGTQFANARAHMRQLLATIIGKPRTSTLASPFIANWVPNHYPDSVETWYQRVLNNEAHPVPNPYYTRFVLLHSRQPTMEGKQQLLRLRYLDTLDTPQHPEALKLHSKLFPPNTVSVPIAQPAQYRIHTPQSQQSFQPTPPTPHSDEESMYSDQSFYDSLTQAQAPHNPDTGTLSHPLYDEETVSSYNPNCDPIASNNDTSLPGSQSDPANQNTPDDTAPQFYPPHIEPPPTSLIVIAD